MNATSQQSTQPKFQNTIYSLADFHVKLSALPAEDWASMIQGEHSFLNALGFYATKDRDILYSKTSKVYLIMTAEKLSRQYLGFAPNLGMTCNGVYLIQKTSEYRKTGKECTLSEILEEQPDPKYFLSEEQSAKLIAKIPPTQVDEAMIGKKLVLIDAAYPSRDARIYDSIAPTVRDYGSGGNKMPFVAIREATKTGYAIAVEGDSVNFAVPNSQTRRGRVGHQIANTLDTGVQQGVIQYGRLRRLTPVECERLQGFPDGWTDGVSHAQRYKQMGNAVTTNVVEAIGKELS